MNAALTWWSVAQSRTLALEAAEERTRSFARLRRSLDRTTAATQARPPARAQAPPPARPPARAQAPPPAGQTARAAGAPRPAAPCHSP
jgi:hypothetical protein